jgi:hypothetical protein
MRDTLKVLKCGAGEGWRRMEKVSWTECMNNEEVLHRVEEEGNILHTVKEGRLMVLVTSCIGIVF